MDFLNKLDSKWLRVAKVVGIVILVLVAVSVVLSLAGTSLRSITSRIGVGSNSAFQGVTVPGYPMDEKMSASYDSGEAYGLSVRNVGSDSSYAPAPATPIYNDNITGDTAEEYEVTEYNASIETRHLDETCSAVSGLKARDYVIFESASEYKRGCNYTFKVRHKNVAEILAVIEGLEPKELSENIYTIKKLVDDYTSEADILKKKLVSIEETLRGAVSAYDDVTALATRVQDVGSLAKIIDSRVNTIERLTQEKININSRLERLARAKADQLDRLEYTYFRVNVFENKFVDGDEMGDSWKAAVQRLAKDVNQMFQNVTINLVVLLLYVLQYAVYGLIILLIVKYGRQIIKKIW